MHGTMHGKLWLGWGAQPPEIPRAASCWGLSL